MRLQLVFVALASCAALVTGASPALARPVTTATATASVLTPSQGLAAVQTYLAKANRANAGYDRVLLHSIEAGDVRRIDEADFSLSTRLGLAPYGHLTLNGTKVFVARQVHYPASFIAVARPQFAGEGKSKYVWAMVFQKATSKDTWRLTAAPTFLPAAVPHLAVGADGYAPPVVPAGLKVTPAALYPASLKALTAASAGGRPSSAWAWNSVWRDSLSVTKARAVNVHHVFGSTHLAPLCFSLASGALCVTSATELRIDDLTPAQRAAGSRWVVDSVDSQYAFGGVAQGRYLWLRTVLDREIAVSVPPKGSTSKLVVLGALTGVISGTGTLSPS